MLLKLQLIAALIAGLFIIEVFMPPTEKNNLYKYKINSFFFSTVWFVIFIILHLYLIFFIRIRLLNNEIDLYALLNKIYKLIFVETYLEIVFNILLGALFAYYLVILTKRAYEFLLTNLLKCYLYYLYDGSHQSNALHFYLLYLTDIGFLTSCVDYLERTTKGISTLHPETWRILISFVQRAPTYFMLAYFIYSLIFNDAVLSKDFASILYGYLLYLYWKKLSAFLTHSDIAINTKVFNMYYRTFSIKYVNFPKEWENIIYKFVDDGLYRIIDETSDFDYNFGLNRELQIMQYHLFKSKDGILYENNDIEYFEEPTVADNNIAVDY